MKISSIPKSGREGSVVYLKTRHGKVVRKYVRPRNPQTPEQQGHRNNLRDVLRRWCTLGAEQRASWCRVAATRDFITQTGGRARLNGYNLFASLNTRRADLGLPQFDLPPAEPVFPPNPVAELDITIIEDRITIRLRVPSPPAQYTLVQGAAPVRSGVRCVQHFPFPPIGPYPRRSLPVVPLIPDKRYYGEAPARIRRRSGVSRVELGEAAGRFSGSAQADALSAKRGWWR